MSERLTDEQLRAEAARGGNFHSTSMAIELLALRDDNEWLREALTDAELWLCRYYTGEPCNHNSVHETIADVRAALSREPTMSERLTRERDEALGLLNANEDISKAACAERDAARALLREAHDDRWGSMTRDLRARIAKELGDDT